MKKKTKEDRNVEVEKEAATLESIHFSFLRNDFKGAL